MTKKTVSLLTVLTTLNIMMLPAFANPMGDAIVAGFQANTEKKIEKANAAKDYSGEVTFMNNHLKLDKAFTKRYNELQPNEAKNCHVTAPTNNCTDEYKLAEDTTKKSNRENIEYWENQMQSARTLSALGQVYYCAKKATTECHYVGGAGGVAKTVNGSARFISKVSVFFGGTEIVSDDWDVRENIDDLNIYVSDEAVCKTSVDSAANTTNEYLEKLKKCEHIDQVRLSEYTEEDIQQLADKYESAKETEQSKANRLLTSASMAATGIGAMELMQGLSEQKADRTAEQAMSAYISTMRCSYGNGKSVKAGTEEIELPGGNNANMMKYRTEYTALAADLKERKNALDMTPGIESEEILDKSQMGLYDDENVGITGGRYASLYRAQMLDSESDQAQLDEAKQTSKTRVIGGAVAAGAGVVGGIVGDELINQSLSSSTKTAQTCTESGGTWQGARCHCPDGFIQRTKTGPCFEEKPTEVQTTTTPQRNNPVLSSNGSGNNGSDGNGQSGSTSDGVNGAGGSDEKGDSSIVDITDTSFEEDEFESAEFDEAADAAVIEYEKSEMCRKFDGNWQNGKCLCTNSFTSNQYIECVQDTNMPTVTTNAAKVAAAGTVINSGTNTDTATSSSATMHRNSNTTSKSDDDNNVNNNSKASDNAGTAVPQANNSTKTPSTTETNKSDSPDTNIPSATKSENPKADEAQSNTSDTKETEQKKVKERPSQNSSKSTPPRANITNGKTTNNNDLSKQDMSKNGTFAKAYSADGRCSIFKDKSWASASTSWCYDLYKGEWKVQFDYGLVRGTTTCDTDGGVEKRLGTPAGKNGQYCWCRAIQYTPNGGSAKNLSLSWMYNYGQTSHEACEHSCAHRCASDIRTNSAIRNKMFK